MDKYDLTMDMTLRMLKVLVCISGKRSQTYVRALIVNYQVLLFHKSHNTEMHKMFSENVSCVNEESGEASFAALSRLITNSTKKSKLKYMCEMYQLLPLYRQIMQEVKMDVQAPLCSRRTVTGITDEDPHVRATRAFLSTFIHEARHNQLCVNPLTHSSVKSLAGARRSMIKKPVVERRYKRHTLDLLKGHIEVCKQKTSTYWLSQYDNIWPEADGSNIPLVGRAIRLGEEVKELKYAVGPEDSDDYFDGSGASDQDDHDDGPVDDVDDDSDMDGDFSNDHSFGRPIEFDLLESKHDVNLGVLCDIDGEPGEGDASEDVVDGDELNDVQSEVVSSVASNMERQFMARTLQISGKRKRKVVDRGGFVD